MAIFPNTLFRKLMYSETQLYRFQHRLHGHTAQITRLAFSTDGELLASGSADEAVRIWDSSTFQCLHTLTQEDFGWGQVTALKWFRDSKYDRVLAIGTGRGYVIFYSAVNNKMSKIYSEVICRSIPIEDLDLDSASRQFMVAEHSGRVHSFKLSADYRLEMRWVTDVSPNHIVRGVRLTADGEVQAFVLNTGKCIVLDSVSGKQTSETRFATAAGEVAFSPDYKHILVDTLLNSFDLYRLDSFEKVMSFKVSHSRLNKVKIGAFIEDGNAIACPNYLRDTVSIFSTTSPIVTDTLHHEQVRVVASCSSLTHHVICTGGKANGTIYVWSKKIHEDRAESYSNIFTFQTTFNILTIVLLLALTSAMWAPQMSTIFTFSSSTTGKSNALPDQLGRQEVLQESVTTIEATPLRFTSALTLTSTVIISVVPTASTTTVYATPATIVRRINSQKGVGNELVLAPTQVLAIPQ